MIKKNKIVLTVTLNPSVDQIICLKKYSTLKKATKTIVLSAGGKGVNVARALAILQRPTVATGIVGGPEGDTIRNFLKEEGIDSEFLSSGHRSRINVTTVHGGGRPVDHQVSPGPFVRPVVIKKFKMHFARLLRRSAFVVFSGRNIPGAPDALYAQLIKMARQSGIRSLLDTSSDALREGLNASPDVVKPNLKEAEVLLGKKILTLGDRINACRAFHRWSKIVLLSLGAEGLMGSDGKQVLVVKSPRQKVLNDVGCGDALVAGFVDELMKGSDFRECMITAAAVGAANTLTLIPGGFDRNDFLMIRKAVSLRRINAR